MLNKFILLILNNITKIIYRLIDHIFIQSEAFKSYIINQDVNEKKISYLPNYAEDFYKPVNSKSEMNFTIIFAGNVGRAQNLNILIQASKLLKLKSVFVKFKIIGDGSYLNEMKENIQLNSLNNYFEFISPQSPNKMPEFFSKSDVLFLSLIKSEIFSYTIPSKLQTYMACRKPILASIDGITNKIINQSKCGYASSSNNTAELVNNIIKLKNSDKSILEKMSENSYEYYKKNFAKTVVLDKLISKLLN